MTPLPNFDPTVPGIFPALQAAGISWETLDGSFNVSDLAASQALIASYNPLSFVQAQAAVAVDAQLASVIAAGFTYQGVLIAIDPPSVAHLTAMAAIASNMISGLITTPWPASFAWLPHGAGPSLALATPQAMVTFAGAVGQYVSACILFANALAAQILAATTLGAVQAINVTAGWPAKGA
jgi:hypothetical protein